VRLRILYYLSGLGGGKRGGKAWARREKKGTNQEEARANIYKLVTEGAGSQMDSQSQGLCWEAIIYHEKTVQAAASFWGAGRTIKAQLDQAEQKKTHKKEKERPLLISEDLVRW